MTPPEKALYVHAEIVRHALEIEELFQDDVKVTVLVRNVETKNANALVSNDDTVDSLVTPEFRKTVDGGFVI